ncbi:MAG: glycosyltransferase family 1 protein [Nitrosomonas sp.]|uniref:glycosyltransferase family 4 protein n=1 Tax=Nitrosomonas sp. TaxID=42353 RepID=UPI0032EFFC3D
MSGRNDTVVQSSTIKILMVTRETRSDQRYGLGRSLMPLVEELRRRGIRTDYLCQGDLGQRALLWQHRLQRLFSVLFGNANTRTDFSLLFQVLLERINMGRLAAKLASAQQYTHVHCHDPFIAAGLHFFLHFHPRCRVAWGVTEHGFGCYAQAIHEDGVHMGPQTMRAMRRWEARTLLDASWVIAPTRSCLKQIADDLKISPLPHNWHDVVHACPALNRYSREEARKQLGWDDTAMYVLSIGRIAPVKRFPLLIEAFAQLKHAKDLQLVILGEGDYSTLQQQARQLGLTREIQFAVTDDIGLYLSATDLYVSASASESFGLANLESLAAGTATVCTAVGGVPEVVGDGAFLVKPDVKSLTEGMQCLLSDALLRESIAYRGKTRADAWPDITEIANRYEIIYRQTAAN